MPNRYFGNSFCVGKRGILISFDHIALRIFVISITITSLFASPVYAQQVSSPASTIQSVPRTLTDGYQQSATESQSFIIRYRPNHSPQELGAQVETRRLRSTNLVGQLTNLVQDASTRLGGRQTPESLLQQLKQTEQTSGVVRQEQLFNRYAVVYVDDSSKTYQAMQQLKSVSTTIESVQPNYIYHILYEPNDPLYIRPSDRKLLQWNLKKLQMDQAWDITKGVPDVKVAVIDTGLNRTHEDLSDQSLIQGQCFATHNPTVLPAPITDDPCLGPGTITEIPRYNCPSTIAVDDNLLNCGAGHGSQMTGIIKAATNNRLGISSIAPDISILSIKVMDKWGQGTSASVAQGINEARTQGVKVINLSLGGPKNLSEDGVVADAITTAVNNNITVFTAAGNDGVDANTAFPASHPKVIAVGATGPNDERASYSNYGAGATTVAISAPGGNPNPGCNEDNCITSTGWDCASQQGGSNTSCYLSAAGTSQATAHASAVAALLLSKKSTLTPVEIKTILIETGDPVTFEASKPIGKRINALKALQRVQSTTTATVTPGGATITPSGPATTHLSGTVRNFASGVSLDGLIIEASVTPTNVVDSVIAPVALDATGTFSLRFTTSQPNLRGTAVQVQFTVKQTQPSRTVGRSQVFPITIGQEFRGLNFTIFFCTKKFEGDANCDNIVDARDFLIWKTEFRDSLENPLQMGRADFNGDGLTDLKDFVFLVGKI